MKFRTGLTTLALLALAVSCASLPPISPPSEADPPLMADREVPLEAFLAVALPRHQALGRDAWQRIWTAYRDACRAEGVNQCLALSQMLLETNALKFGGDVKPSQNNFAGLGVTGGGRAGLSFPDVATGALAHVQHLKAYGSVAPLNRPSVDPRFRLVRRGSATTLSALTGRWAQDPAYAQKLLRLYRLLAGGLT